MRSRFNRLKKLSATALSWQFPRRLMLCSRLWCFRNDAHSKLVNWLPWSELVLSRFGSSPLIAYYATKEINYGTNTPRGCIHHSDRGSQYCSHDYQKILRQHGFKVSMSGKGNCYDNAAMETFFKTIKAELIWRHSWLTRRAVEVAIFEHINGFYNPRRRHSALGWKSPLAFEQKVA